MRKPRHIKIERFPIMSRDQWLALRAGDVTASVIGALFGLHPYKTPMGLFAEKTGVLREEEQDTVVLRRGRLLESAVAEAYREKHPSYKVTKMRHYYRAPKLRLGATPDFALIDDQGRRAVLQAKTLAPLAFKRAWTDETAPTWISLQCLTEAMMLRADYGVIAALIVDGYRFDLHEYIVPRHDAAERRIQEGVAKFWGDIAAGRTPQFDYTADRSLLAVMYPRHAVGKIVDLRGDNELPGLLDERERLKDEAEEKIDQQRAIETRLMAQMGDAEAAQINGWRITFKQQHRKAYAVDATDYRVLRIARDREKAA
jgi:predicted phage-related endonuclease